MEKVMMEFEDTLMQYTGIQRDEARELASYLMSIIEASEGMV